MATTVRPPLGINRPLQGRGLYIAKGCWLVLVGLTMVALILGSVHIYKETSHVCTPVRKSYCLLLETLGLADFSQNGLAFYLLACVFIIAVPWLVMGWLVFIRKSETVADLLMSLGLAAGWASDLSSNNIRFAFFDAVSSWPQLLPLGLVCVYLVGFVSQATVVVLAYLIPDGRFPARWSLWLALIWFLHIALNTLYRYPFGLLQSSPFVTLDRALSLLAPLSILFTLWFRYRFVADERSKRQLRAILPSTAALAGTYAFSMVLALFIWYGEDIGINTLRFGVHLAQSGIQSVCAAWFAVSVGLAILRYNLFDVNLYLSRALVYGGLSLGLLGVYLLATFGLQSLLGVEQNIWISALTTAFIVLLFQFTWKRLEGGVNQLLYGGRSNPPKLSPPLSHGVHQALDPSELFPSVARTLSQQLSFSHVGIVAGSELWKTDTCVGTPAADVKRFPFLAQGESLGWLEVSLPSGEVLDADEYKLLETTAEQLTVSAKAIQLTFELQAARQQLVAAREEERRRVQRDLHDGLGPAIAAQTLVVSSARRLLRTDPQRAEQLLTKLENDIHRTLTEMRSLIYSLRPPDLDQLGLEGALRPKLRELAGETLKLELVFPAAKAAYPAAVEVAAYHITTEAVSNVVRHARAGLCTVELKVSGANLELSVTDDGVGLTGTRSGVGMASMRERAQELGGNFLVLELPNHPGVRVRASLPLTNIEKRRLASVALEGQV